MVMVPKAVLSVTTQISMADKTDILSKYSGTPYPPLEKTQPSPELVKTESENYQAVVELKRGTRSPRFKIVDGKGISYGCSYAHLLDWTFQPPALLTLNTATRIFTIEGKNLETIERLLMEERVKELHEFNPKLNTKPDGEMAIIEKIEIASQ